MDSTLLATTVQNTLMVILVLSSPVLGVAILVGFFMGLFQAVTQIQDQSLPQACKIVAVLLGIAVGGRLMSGVLIEYTNRIMDNLPSIGSSVVRR